MTQSQDQTARATMASPREAAAAPVWLGFACGAGAALIWGIQAVVSRQSVADGLSAADVTVLRFLAAGLVLLPYALPRLRPFPVGDLGWCRALILTLLAGAPYSLVLVGGSTFAPALHTAVVTPGLIPVLAALLAFLVGGERPPPARLAGLGLIVAGIVVFSWQAFGGGAARAGAWRGDLLFVLAAVMWAVFGLLAKRWQTDALRLTVTICLLSLVSAPLLALVVPLHMAGASAGALALQAIYQGLLVGVVSLFLYAKANAVLGAARAALFLPLVPVVTATAGALIIGEWPSPPEIAGMTIAMAGMTLALRAGERRR
ncbi:DMT family transporter [Phreatobacter sp. AB_2022a]|uniref:DMT family transporter n=1 Tax=Phreatobacter sp. AB_2022a TaxID=3003134 RepID=UPI0022870367|nr:DMT family transporter [Phreatobacter sp. AB_2022a]MCZ0733140.1 DMT family transporter [Phreatobacter sp. AB_2022a]